jgi:hypothetical protein
MALSGMLAPIIQFDRFSHVRVGSGVVADLEFGLAYLVHSAMEVAMPELSPEGEAVAAYGAATMAALKILVICLQSNGALERGQFPEALRLFMEAAKDDADDMTLSILHDLRTTILE